MSSGIISQLISHPLYKQAQTILLYHSIADEVYTHDLIMEACKSKTVLLPTVKGDNLELHTFTPSTTMHKGLFCISESDGPLFTDYASINLAVLPGMAFDASGNRLGRGKGYYDRLLPLLSCPTIGICFPFQFVEQIPVEPHDRKVNEVIH